MKSWGYMGACIVITTSLILTGCQSAKSTETLADSNQSTESQSTSTEKPVEAPAKEVIQLPEAFKGKWIFKEDDLYNVTINDTTMLSGDKNALYTTETFEVINYNEISKKADLKIYSYQEEAQDKPVAVEVKASLTLKDNELVIYYEATEENDAVESVWIKEK